MTRIAVYPGSFDPITNGHLSLIRRSMDLFDELIVAVAINPDKSPLFTTEERLEMIQEAVAGMSRVKIDSFEGLLVNYVASKDSHIILRGVRALSDFEYEFQLALMNRRLSRDIQSVFLMTDYKWFYISSTIIKQAAQLGGVIEGLVPPNVCRRLKEKFGQEPCRPRPRKDSLGC